MLKLLNKSTKHIFSAAALLAGAALTSRVLGLVRDRVLAGTFGAGDELDIYYTAFRIPDLAYNLIIGGAVSSAFIPVFISYLTKNKKEAWLLANSFFFWALVFLSLTAAALFLFLPFLLRFVAPGFSEEKLDQTLVLSRIMLLSPVFLGLSAIFSGVLHVFRKFFVYSLAPIFYNLGIILGVLFFVPWVGLSGLAWGVALGAFLHLLLQLPVTIMSGFRFIPFYPFYPGVKRIIRLILPRSLGLGAFQINLWVITAIASTLSAGSIAVFNLANNLQYLPIGLVGISLATASFPAFAEAYSGGKKEEYIQKFKQVFASVLFLVLPLSVFIFVLRAQIVRVVLGAGKFGWEDTQLTAAVLGAFSFGIFAHALVPLLARAFYARENTKTPVILTTAGLAVNIILSFILVRALNLFPAFAGPVREFFKVEQIGDISLLGLPLAFAVSGLITAGLLVFSLSRRFGGPGLLRDFSASFLRISIVSIIAGIVVFALLRVPVIFFELKTFWAVFLQGGLAASGGVVAYILLFYILRFRERKLIPEFLPRRFRRTVLPQRGPTHYNGTIY